MESLQVLQASKGYEMIKKKAEDMYDMIKISILTGEELMSRIWHLLEVKEIKAIKALLPNVSEQEIINKIMDAIAHDETRSFDDHEKQQTILDMITYHSLQWKTFTMSSNQRTEYILFKGLQMKTKILNQNSARTTRFQRGGFKSIKKIQKPSSSVDNMYPIHPNLPKPQFDPLPFNGFADISNDTPLSDFSSDDDDYVCSPLEHIQFPLQNPHNSPVDSDDDNSDDPDYVDHDSDDSSDEYVSSDDSSDDVDTPYCPSSPQYDDNNESPIDDDTSYHCCDIYGKPQDFDRILRISKFILDGLQHPDYHIDVLLPSDSKPHRCRLLFVISSKTQHFIQFHTDFILSMHDHQISSVGPSLRFGNPLF